MSASATSSVTLFKDTPGGNADHMTRIIIYKDFDLIGGGFSGAGGTDKQVKALADANGVLRVDGVL